MQLGVRANARMSEWGRQNEDGKALQRHPAAIRAYHEVVALPAGLLGNRSHAAFVLGRRKRNLGVSPYIFDV